MNDNEGNPDRDRRGRRLAGRRHRGGGVPGRRLQQLREGADRVGAAQPGDELQLRRARRHADVAARHTPPAVAEHLKKEIQDRLARAGVEVMEARISHLAYAPEIAQAMLQRQQAGAIIAARQRIVEGAVGMVEMALDMLSQRDIVALDNERKAAMVSNLLVVLCGERSTQPIINTGTDLSIERPWPTGSRSCFGSIATVLDAVQRWADDDLRSLNGQIEFLLRKALKEAKRSVTGQEAGRPRSSAERRSATLRTLLRWAAAAASTGGALRDDRRAADRARAASAGSRGLSGRRRP